MSKRVMAYGSWESPISAEAITRATMGLSQVILEGEDAYWAELRPGEGGRYVVVRLQGDGSLRDMLPSGVNARTRVHEYGGGSYFAGEGAVYYSDFRDQRIYRAGREGGQPEPVTPEVAMRYADGTWDANRRRIVCVREDHTGEGEAVNTVAAIDTSAEASNTGQVLVEGGDFYAAPRLSPDGSQLAWLTWNHPDMPWDAAALWVAPVNADGSLGTAAHIAGGGGESVVQPEWSPDGVLHFICDRSNWWNLYRFRDGQVESLAPMEAEFARPHWTFRPSTYAFQSADRIVCAFGRQGLWSLATLDTTSGKLTELDTPYNMILDLRADSRRAVFVAGSASEPRAVVEMDLESGARRVLRWASELRYDEGYLSVPEPVEFPTEDGKTAFGLYYAPKNKDFAASPDEKPPLMVKVHGGPTSANIPALVLGVQYYTSRGFAVMDVNYGGSAGYGREYRDRLQGQWGVVDVDDACNAALHLAREDRVDGNRMAISGGSAGGYTTLAALAFRDVFAAGGSHFGVSDCERLALDTHKFESRYLDGLIGPYPERQDLYRERSPIYHVDGLSCPVIFFQGLEDKIVPPDQAEKMVDALDAKGIPVAYVPFEGEQHGFRKAENMRRALEAQYYFFSRIFGFTPADTIEPVEIRNLP
jgi:dipeptidyl aminopeptidase/acylaminoacyl peptidase